MPQIPHAHPREHPTKQCLCENEVHFAKRGSASTDDSRSERPKPFAHAYGIDFRAVHIAFVRTPWGTFAACPACVSTCLADYEVVG